MEELKELDRELINRLFPVAKKATEDYHAGHIQLVYSWKYGHRVYHDLQEKISIIDFTGDGKCTFGAYERLDDGGVAIVTIFEDMDGSCRYSKYDKNLKTVISIELTEDGEIIKY